MSLVNDGRGWLARRAVMATVLAVVLAALAGADGPARAAYARRWGDGVAAGVISTVAGGVGGPNAATSVSLTPQSVSYSAGQLYVGDGAAVRAVNQSTDGLTTVAGTGGIEPLGDGGPAVSASVASRYVPVSIGTSADSSGNLLIGDPYHHRVRVVAKTSGTFYGQAMTAGDIYTIAGNGVYGDSGDGGPATSAELANPGMIAVDSAGNVVIPDFGDSVVRVVAESSGLFYGQAMTPGNIYTVAGNGSDSYSGDGGPATQAALSIPDDARLDGAGNLVIADAGNSRVRVVAARNGTFYGQAMTGGNIYTVAGNGTAGFSGDGGPAISAEFAGLDGMLVDGAGNLVIADGGNNRVRVVAARNGTFYGQPMTAGDIYTVAGNGSFAYSGDGGPAANAQLDSPQDAVADHAGNLVIADSLSDRVRVVAHSTGTFYGQAMTAGNIYTVAGNGSYGFSGDGGPATSAQLADPWGVVVDRWGNLVIADRFAGRVRVVANSTGTFYGRKMTAGDIYTVAGNGQNGFSGDGGPATSAALGYPEGVTVDGAANLVIADTGNDRIRVVAESTSTFYGQAMTAGDIYSVAGNGQNGFSGDGGLATKAKFKGPRVVAVDGAGNLAIADAVNDRIRVVAESTGTFYGRAMKAGDVYTVAGNGQRGYSGDGGPATSAALKIPDSVTADSWGNLVIADTGNKRIRVVAESTGSFYGQAMTAGDIYTVAGIGIEGFSGDGGPGTSAELDLPAGVTVDGTGDLVIADTSNNRIREVAG